MSERHADDSYRVEVEGDPVLEGVVWGTYLYWARTFDMWDRRFELKRALIPMCQGLSVDEGGCSFGLYTQPDTEVAALIVKSGYGKVRKELMAKVISVQKILRPLFDPTFFALGG